MTRLLSAEIAATALVVGPAPALADHGGATGSGPANPLAVAVVAGLLALAIGIAVFAILMRLGRKTPRSE